VVHSKATSLHWLSSVQLVQCSTVQWSQVELSWVELSWVDSCEHQSWGSYGIGSHYQVTTSVDTVDWEGLVHPVVNSWVCELAIELQLLALTICKCSINSITNQNPNYSHSPPSDNWCQQWDSIDRSIGLNCFGLKTGVYHWIISLQRWNKCWPRWIPTEKKGKLTKKNGGQPNGNDSWPRTPERINDSQEILKEDMMVIMKAGQEKW
jgi:hypothetical protein